MTSATSSVYLNTASSGLLQEETLKNTFALYNDILTGASAAAEAIRDSGLQRIKDTLATFLQAPVSSLAFIPNFSYGLNAVVQSLNGTEKVLLYKHDFPSVSEPFRINKFDITWIDSPDGFSIDIEALKNALLANNIEILAISHVQWLSGYTLDMEDIGSFCRQHNILFIADTTQSLGALPVHIDKLDVDVMISSNYKWMNAGFGTGIMYVSDSFLERYKPVIGGFNSIVMEDGEWKNKPSAKNYEPGHLNLHGLLVLEEAVKLKMAKGIDRIAQHNYTLASQLLDGILAAGHSVLGPASMENRCSIVMMKADEQLHKYLMSQGIVAIKRGEYMRLSLHFYNIEADVRYFLKVLRAYNA